MHSQSGIVHSAEQRQRNLAANVVESVYFSGTAENAGRGRYTVSKISNGVETDINIRDNESQLDLFAGDRTEAEQKLAQLLIDLL